MWFTARRWKLSHHTELPVSTQRPVIAHVLHRLYLAGAEVLAAALARQLRDQFEFIFLCLDETGPLGEQLADEGFTVVDLERKPGVDLAVAKRIKQINRDKQVALLHAHQYTPFFYASMSRGVFKRRPRLMFTEHGRHYPDIRKTKHVLANKLLLRSSDTVTAVGKFVKQALVNNEGIKASRIEVIYNGIDTEKFSVDVDGSRRSTARASLGIDPQRPVVLQVARFHPVKDHETAVRAFHVAVQAMADSPDAAQPPLLLLAGDGDKKKAMETLVTSLGIADHVQFLGVRDDVPDLMAAADLFILSSLSEGISVTLLEAMGAGVPIATTDVGGNSEVVDDGESGLLSPRGDRESLGKNIATLLLDADMRQRMGTVGHERLLATFTEQAMHARYAELYHQITSH